MGKAIERSADSRDFANTSLPQVRLAGRQLFRKLLHLLPMLVVVAGSWSLSLAQTAGSAGQRVVHQSWTFKDGAPEGVQALAQTSDGYLWLGTQFGLFRFDGMHFEAFRPTLGDQLMSTSIAALFADREGGLWVGYLFGGFSFVKNGKVTNFVESVGATQTILGFAQDRNGVVWSATGLGLWRFEASQWQPIPKEWNAPVGIIYQVGFDRDGILWVLAGWSDTARQLFYLIPNSKHFEKAGDYLAAKLSWDADHNVLTTHDRTVSLSDAGIHLDDSIPARPILRKDSGQIVDRANGIWIMPLVYPFLMRQAEGESVSETLRKVSPGNSEVYDVNPNHFAFLVDHEGGVWFGDSKGIHRFSYSPVMNQEFPKQAPTFALAPGDKGDVWVVAGDYNSATVYRVTEGKAVEKSSLNLQNFAYRARDGSMWFGGKAGLWRAVNGTLSRVDLPPEVANNPIGPRTITEDRFGGMWLSFSGNTLYRYADGVWTLNGGRYDFPKQLILTEFTDSVGRVWFGSSRSKLTVLDGHTLQTFGPNDGLAVGNIMAICGRGPGIWIGGEFGLQQFSQGRFHTILSVDKEVLRGISGIVETKNGDLWLNSLGGIFHVTHAEIEQALKTPGNQVVGERFGRREGLPGLPLQIWPIPTAIEGTDGRLWFTVNNGVVWLDPERASNNAPAPAVTIQAVSVNDKGYRPDGQLRVPSRDSNLQISYAAVSLSSPETVRFRYKLQEFDEGWHDAGSSTSVSYHSLPPGSYHFVVNATDSDGLWSKNAATTEFTVLPAFYQTHWFIVLCTMALLALVWAAYQWRVRQLHQQFEMKLDARVGERTRIARELHDTLLQSAHGVLLRFQTVSHLLPARPLEAKETLDSAIEQTSQFITEARDEVQGLRDSTVEGIELPVAISTLLQRLANSESQLIPEFQVTVEGTALDLRPIIREEIYKITSEALRNVFRHAEADRIEVEIRYDKEEFRLRVRDDGKGIDPTILASQGREGHYGLHGMRERASLIGGTLTVWSEVHSGTEVELRVPVSSYAAASKPFRLFRKLNATA